MTHTLSWGILGTGNIAHVFARGLAASQTGKLLAVGSRTQAAADRFGETWQLTRRYHSYEQLLADKDVEAVYIALPHPFHAEWAVKAAEAGKHILCEKPVGLNHAEAMLMIEAARRHDVFFMEAFMYRCHPQTEKLVELIRSGAIGTVRVIEATFSFQTQQSPEGRLLNNALGGGGILDVGGYCTSMARLIAGVATGKAFAEPGAVKGVAHIGAESHIDEYALASLSFPGGVVAQLFTGVRVLGENEVRIFGSDGSIVVPVPWVPKERTSTILLKQQGQVQEITVENPENVYALEADTVAAHLAARQAPAMSWDDTLGNMKTLDLWRESIGLVYDKERPAGQKLPLHQRPLSVGPDAPMIYGRIPGLTKTVSRLVMGVDNQRTWPHTAAMLDDFFEQGGNCFDSAYIYGGGLCEQMLGHWVANRGVREQVVLLDKGAHTPFCTPAFLVSQLETSLQRLQTDYVDIYMMHRDNLQVPVDEFITVLNEQQRAGRIRLFGASNWSIERVEAANAWATAHGMNGFTAMSNNLSLARMVQPVWAGCLSVSDAQSREWLQRQQMTLMPWSSQARGFFTGRAHPNDMSDPELVRAWYSDDNFQRLARVEAMAKERGVLPIAIALAYVLCQPFPTFPLIGPRTLEETRTSLSALSLHLTPQDLRWLNLEE